MKKRLFAGFLSVILALALPCSALAVPATPSDTARATPSDALPPYDSIYDDVALPEDERSSLGSVNNTVNYSDMKFQLSYYDMSSVRKTLYFPVSSDGRVSIPLPKDYVKLDSMGIYILGKALPPSGKYRVTFDFTSDTGIDWNADSFRLWTSKGYHNAQGFENSVRMSARTNSGDVQASASVDLGSVASFYLYGTVNSGSPPWGGTVKVNFTRLTSDSSVDGSTAGGGSADSAEDVQNNIADNTGQLVDEQKETNGLLMSIIQTISNQLSAFWDQLAGVFTDLFTKMNEQHQEDLDAMQGQTDDLVSNQDKNTDKITDGYDSSGLDGSNQELNDSMGDFSKQEDQIMDQISEPLDDFEFKDPVSQYLDTFRLLGDFMQDLFSGSGGFKDVINLSFLIGIALMVAGLYRFKGGT